MGKEIDLASMKTQHILITIHFLEILRNNHQETEHLAKIREAFAFLLEKKELIAIAQLIYNGEAEKEHPNLHQKTEAELLDLIKDQYYVLEYMIEEVWGAYTL